MSDRSQEILAADRAAVWHPYTSFDSPVPVFPVQSARANRITLADGRELIDGMSSWWAAIHGYNHPVINRAAHAQVDELAHIMFGGLTHEPAVGLCERLVNITSPSLTRVFLSDSGSVAVEVAIKMAFQYWIGRGREAKNRLLTVRNGYHGDTFAAMSVCDPVNGMHHMFQQVLSQHLFAPAPQSSFHGDFNPSEMASIESLFEEHADSIAAVILEPVVQGAGGMRFYHPDYLVHLRRLCDQYQVLLILDEIATGFGRSGKMFANEHALKADGSAIEADILCLGKALTGGYMSLAATLCRDEIAEGICASEAGAFMHGPTFMGNPLACRVAQASIDLLLEQDWQAEVARIESALRAGLAPALERADVADVRVLGAIGVIEMQQPVDMPRLQQALVDAGIWVRPFGRLVYLMPPYISPDEDLQFLCKQLLTVLSGR